MRLRCGCEKVKRGWDTCPVLRPSADKGAAAAEGPWAAAHGGPTAGGGRSVADAAAVAASSVGGVFGPFRCVLSDVFLDLSV